MNEDFYNKQIASNYEHKRKTDRFWDWEEQNLINIINGLEQSERTRILDCPVGTGRFIKDMAPMCSQYTGVDISQYMLNMAEKKLQHNISNVKLLRCDVANLEDRFDVIICFRLLHLLDIENAVELLSKLSRLTDGYIILQAFDVHDYRIAFPNVMNFILNFGSVGGLRYLYRSIRSLFSGKIFRKGGSVAVNEHQGDYSDKTYWLNMRTLRNIFKKNNMRIVNDVHLKDSHHYENENYFISTKIILLKINA